VRSTDPRRVVAALLTLAVVSGCGAADGPQPTGAIPASSASHAADSHVATPTTTPAEPTRTPGVAVDPGQPYDAPAILAAMRSSRRPGGVPGQLQTDAVADAVASQIWTFDGRPWPQMSIGASCGPSSCTLDVGGTPSGAVGEDLYVMHVTPSNGSVDVVEASLHGLTQELVDRLDRLARAAWDGGELDGLVLASTGWQVPPDDSEFVLSYRSGGEEGAPAVDLVLDLESGTATER
jgi:hypothetical protein